MGIFFKPDILLKASKAVPVEAKDFWKIKFTNPLYGIIRILEETVVAFYFYVDTKIQDKSILKFSYIDSEIKFDSVYVEKNLFGRTEHNTEYRYDKDNNLIASYTWGKSQPFCSQNKVGDKTKTYTRIWEPQPASQPLKDISQSYLTREIAGELISCFHTSGNTREVYWIIK